MIKGRFYRFFPPLFILGELLLISAVYLLSIYISHGILAFKSTYTSVFIAFLVVWPVISYVSQSYKIGRGVSYYTTLRRAFTSAFIFVSLISLFWLFFELKTLNRPFLVTLTLSLFLWITVYRVFVHLALDKYRTFGGNIRYALIIGYDPLGFGLFDVLKKKPHYGIQCKGFYGGADHKNEGYPLLGDYQAFFKSNIEEIDYIYISDNVPRKVLNEVIRFADDQSKKVKLVPKFKTDLLKNFVMRRYDYIPIVDINNLPLDGIVNRTVKRAFDIVFSLTILIVLMSWMVPLIALITKLESPGPVFFKQLRHGKDNRPFWCYKFRTMRLNEKPDTQWAVRNDPRVTRFGAFLRRTSLDEFPQAFNVLIGDMSIVGPRPHAIAMNEYYEKSVQKYSKRHSSKPGMTGLAQSMGYRGEIMNYYQMNSRVRLDRFYLQNWSFWLDIKIIFLTIYSLIRGQELAY